MFNRAAVIVAAWTGLTGCAVFGPAGVGQETAPTTAAQLQRQTDPSKGISSVLLVPLGVEKVEGLGSADGCRVAMGALFTTRTLDDRTISALALVIQAAGSRPGPLLSQRRELVLSVDGATIQTSPRPDAGLYKVQPGPFGFVETVIVPVSAATLRRLSEASTVRATLGEKVEFDLNREHRTGFATLLKEIPAHFRLTEARVTRASLIAP